MDPVALIPLGVTCVLTLGAWLATLLYERRVASSPPDEAAGETVQDAWFLY